MYTYGIKMLGQKMTETNISSSNKWQVYNIIPLCRILSLSARAPLWKIARKKVNIFSMRKEDYQFRVACVSYLNLKQNKAFKESDSV